MSFQEKHRERVTRLQNWWFTKGRYTKPELFFSVPLNFLFDVILGKSLRGIACVLVWVLTFVGNPVLWLSVYYLVVEVVLPEALVFLSNADGIGLLVAAYAIYQSHQKIKHIPEKFQKFVFQANFRELLNTPNGKRLHIFNWVAFGIFLVCFFSIDEQSNTFVVFLLLLSFYIFWQGFYFTAHKLTAQLLIVYMVLTPLVIHRVKSRPDLFPDSPLHKKQQEAQANLKFYNSYEEFFAENPEYAKLYIEGEKPTPATFYYGLCQEDQNLDYQQNLRYTVCTEQESFKVLKVGRVSRGLKSGFKMGMRGVKSGTKGSLKRIGKNIAKITKKVVRAAADPILRISKPVKRVVGSAVTRTVKVIKARATEIKLARVKKLALKKPKGQNIEIGNIAKRKKAVEARMKKLAEGWQKRRQRAAEKWKKSKQKSVEAWQKRKAKRAKVKAAKAEQMRINEATPDPFKAKDRGRLKRFADYFLDTKARHMTAKPLQNPASNFRNQRLLNEHWDGYYLRNGSFKPGHAQEFPNLRNKMEYERAARDFMNNPPKGTLTGKRDKTWGPSSEGDVVRYHEDTNTLGIIGKDGKIKTMFKPVPDSEIGEFGYKTKYYKSAKKYFYSQIGSKS